MSQITVVQDPQLEKSEIVIALTNSSESEAGPDYESGGAFDNRQSIQQTQIYGIEAPLIAINKIVIDFTDVIDLTLECIGPLPTISMIVRDRYQLVSKVDTPRMDNEIRLQIIPKFEDAYKKIDLTFFISGIRINGNNISLTGTYKVPELFKSRFQSLGEISTYEIFMQASNDTGIGFATNIEANDADKRFIYQDNKSWMDTLAREITFANANEQILDWWIDWWDYINLADVMERYKTIDPDEELQIWVASMKADIEEGEDYKPTQVVALLNNHPVNQSSELYVKEFVLVNNTGANLNRGTDRVYGIYEMEKEEYMDHLIQDGDVEEDIFIKTEYLGEVYGSYNYLLSGKQREAFLQKIRTTGLEVDMTTPLLALMRGHKVNVANYINDSEWSSKMDMLKDKNYIRDVESNIPLNEEVADKGNNSDNGTWEMDKSISGQYLITGCRMKYYDSKWHYLISLARPADQTPKIINDEE